MSTEREPERREPDAGSPEDGQTASDFLGVVRGTGDAAGRVVGDGVAAAGGLLSALGNALGSFGRDLTEPPNSEADADAGRQEEDEPPS